jgi:hypothetical protein
MLIGAGDNAGNQSAIKFMRGPVSARFEWCCLLYRVGRNHIYAVYIYGISGLEVTKNTVIYGVYRYIPSHLRHYIFGIDIDVDVDIYGIEIDCIYGIDIYIDIYRHLRRYIPSLTAYIFGSGQT